MHIKSLAVYCSSSDHIHEKYKKTAKEVGELLAKNSVHLVYGGGNTGLMKIVADSCMESGGHVLGIMTEHLQDLEYVNRDVTELRIEKCMHARKKKMFSEADGFIALPGGLGTLEEIFEILTWKQIGLHTKPFVFFNQDGFWDPVQSLIDEMIHEKTTPSWTNNLFCMATQVVDILPKIKLSIQKFQSSEQKWIRS